MLTYSVYHQVMNYLCFEVKGGLLVCLQKKMWNEVLGTHPAHTEFDRQIAHNYVTRQQRLTCVKSGTYLLQ